MDVRWVTGVALDGTFAAWGTALVYGWKMAIASSWLGEALREGNPFLWSQLIGENGPAPSGWGRTTASLAWMWTVEPVDTLEIRRLKAQYRRCVKVFFAGLFLGMAFFGVVCFMARSG